MSNKYVWLALALCGSFVLGDHHRQGIEKRRAAEAQALALKEQAEWYGRELDRAKALKDQEIKVETQLADIRLTIPEIKCGEDRVRVPRAAVASILQIGSEP